MDASLNKASFHYILFMRMKPATLISNNSFDNKFDHGSLSPMWKSDLQIT